MTHMDETVNHTTTQIVENGYELAGYNNNNNNTHTSNEVGD